MKNEFKYSPFGESPVLSGSTFGFTGQRYDAETGLYYFKARYYSPSLGRFLQTDPIGFRGGGLNLYTYGLNDPLNKPDPSGLAPTSTTTSSYDLGSLLSPGGYDDQSDDDGGSNSETTPQVSQMGWFRDRFQILSHLLLLLGYLEIGLTLHFLTMIQLISQLVILGFQSMEIRAMEFKTQTFVGRLPQTEQREYRMILMTARGRSPSLRLTVHSPMHLEHRFMIPDQSCGYDYS